MKERILEGADSLFMRYGIKSMTMDDIAKHLSVSKKTIYQYFKNKNELVESVLQDHFEKEQTKIFSITKNAENAIDELFQVSKYLKSVMMDMNPSVILDLQKFYPDAWALFKQHEQQCVLETIIKNLDWGKKESFYRSELNTQILAKSRVAQIELGFDPTLFPHDQFSILEVQLELLNHFIMGIVTPKGFELFNSYINQNE